MRVVAVRPSFEKFVTTAFDQIRISADGNAAIYLRLLTALSVVGQRTKDPRRTLVLRRQRGLIGEAAERTLQTEYERTQVRERLALLES